MPTQQPVQPAASRITTTQPVFGVWLRLADGAHVDTVSATKDGMELRLTAGVANVTVHHPAQGALLLVDLPGGQVSLVNDGIYTFNAQTNTVRTIRGEADALPANGHAIRIKEEHQFTFVPGADRASEATLATLRTDFLPGPTAVAGTGSYPAGTTYPGNAYAAGPYGDGPYYYPYPAYPYYAYNYGWGYPYGWYGYPYFGVGFGWYGGFGGYYGGRFRR